MGRSGAGVTVWEQPTHRSASRMAQNWSQPGRASPKSTAASQSAPGGCRLETLFSWRRRTGAPALACINLPTSKPASKRKCSRWFNTVGEHRLVSFPAISW